MAEQVEEIPVDDVTMPGEEMAITGAGEFEAMPDEEMAMAGAGEFEAMAGEEMAITGAGEFEAMPDEEMAMAGEIQAIELPGTWKLILSRTSPKSSGRS